MKKQITQLVDDLDGSVLEPEPVPGKPKPHPLEGVYVLRERVLDGDHAGTARRSRYAERAPQAW